MGSKGLKRALIWILLACTGTYWHEKEKERKKKVETEENHGKKTLDKESLKTIFLPLPIRAFHRWT